MTYSFCEPVTATTLSREHVRRVGPEGPKPGGGIPDGPHGMALCGFDVSRGWDNRAEVTGEAIARGLTAEVNPTCQGCADQWRAENGAPR